MTDGQQSTVTCLCLETFPEGEKPYLRLTDQRVVDQEGRRCESGLVCCNDCWLKMSLFERSILAMLHAPAIDGGLKIGSLLAERLWPQFMKSPEVASAQEVEEATRDVPPMQVPRPETPPGQHITELREARKKRRERPR